MAIGTYQNISLEFPAGLIALNDIVIDEKLGEHGKAYVSGILDEGEEKNVLDKFNMGTKIRILQDGNEVLFCGVPVSVNVKHAGQSYLLSAELMTCSILLDIAKKSKSYQNVKYKYESIFQELLSEVNGECKDLMSKGAVQKGPYIRYQETSWEFIKRMASYFGGIICVKSDCKVPKLIIGLPKSKSHNADLVEYTTEKDMAEVMTKRPLVDGVKELNYIAYHMTTGEHYSLGDQVNVNGKPYIVVEKHSKMTKGELLHTYHLRLEGSIKQEPIYNESLSGISFTGTILSITNDKLKIHLSIDEKQSEGEAYPYTFTTSYAANGSTGWFAMPEKGQSVQLFIPEHDETKAYITKVNRTDGADNSKTADPATSYFGTAEGKEMTLSPSDMTFSAEEGKTYLTLSNDGGVTVQTGNNISIKAEQGISLYGESFSATSKDKIIMATQNTTVVVDNVMHIKG